MNEERESDMFTAEELVDILGRYWESTRAWDPWISGQMDADLEGLDPAIPEQLAQRKRIVESHSLTHDWATGQRMAVGLIKRAIADGRLRAASREHWSKKVSA